MRFFIYQTPVFFKIKIKVVHGTEIKNIPGFLKF
jgi:hypothetical protein